MHKLSELLPGATHPNGYKYLAVQVWQLMGGGHRSTMQIPADLTPININPCNDLDPLCRQESLPGAPFQPGTGYRHRVGIVQITL
jgi:hypothetical protein